MRSSFPRRPSSARACASSSIVVKDDKVERRVIRIGQRQGGRVEVVEGLTPGETIVVRGVQRVRPGAVVKARQVSMRRPRPMPGRRRRRARGGRAPPTRRPEPPPRRSGGDRFPPLPRWRGRAHRRCAGCGAAPTSPERSGILLTRSAWPTRPLPPGERRSSEHDAGFRPLHPPAGLRGGRQPAADGRRASPRCMQLPVREYPSVDPPVVSVSTVYRGASNEVIESRITEIIEGAVAGIEGIRQITSQSQNDRSSVIDRVQRRAQPGSRRLRRARRGLARPRPPARRRRSRRSSARSTPTPPPSCGSAVTSDTSTRSSSATSSSASMSTGSRP